MPPRKKSESERFKGPTKYAEYLAARAVVSLLQRLPIGLAYRLGRGIGWLAWKTMKRRRATVRKNLEIVNSWMDERAEGGDCVKAEGGDLRPERFQSDKGIQSPPTQVSGFRFQPSGVVSGCSGSRWDRSCHSLTRARNRSQVSPELAAQVREVFQRAGANLFAGFTFARMSPQQADKHIHIEGLDQLKVALAKGKGAIILLAHMGPWEALAQLPGLAQKHGIDAPFGAIYRKFNNAYLDAWFRRQREASGTRLFGSRYKFYAPVDFLRAGGMLGVLADQRASGGERVDYFGVRTHVTPLPGLLHLRSKAPLFALSISTEGCCQWQLRIHALSQPDVEDTANARQIVAQATACTMKTVLAESPLDGFWFTDRFKDVKAGIDHEKQRWIGGKHQNER
ncbi:MAG: hypothetical protein GVY36_15585 [Verrucomicrobia bacterium]|jgi:KDO2-lipid IV(A) lauroyltransferase|nr:hypothetical protein [Verrucomicrobiota bacterium]